jgi:hypothetical protein
MNVLAIVALSLILLTGPAHAQTGTIAGQVRDASGAVLRGVAVTVTSPALIEKVRSTTTDGSGRYQIIALPVGTYAVEFKLQNFNTVRREVVLTSDFTATVTGDMKVKKFDEEATVILRAPIVDVRNAKVQTTFLGSDVADLPTERHILGMLALVSSVVTSPANLRGVCRASLGGLPGNGMGCDPTVAAFNSNITPLEASGGSTQGRTMVDGMPINAGRPSLVFGAANGLTLDTASVQEVTFTLSGNLGESETGGALINIVPRTGGNRFAGSYYTGYLDNRFIDRNRGTRVTETPDVQEHNYDYDVNAAFGGPILRDRLWFYTRAGNRGVDRYPSFGNAVAYSNLNEGLFGANYVPDRDGEPLSFRNEFRNANVRLTVQATPRNKFNVYWDEQSTCAYPCYGTVSVAFSPEASWSNQSSPTRLTQLSWTNPFTNRVLFEAGLTYLSAHEDTTKHREFTNHRQLPRVCETGPTVGRDGFALKSPPVPHVADTQSGAGTCVFNTMTSGSINTGFGTAPELLAVVRNDDTYRSRATASYVTGSHNAKFGFEGAYFAEKARNEVNDLRLSYHYQTPNTAGTWNAASRSGNCLLAPAADTYACGNMNLYYAADDPTNRVFLRPRPVGFEMNTGPVVTEERVWFGALYVQDQWTVGRFTLSGALRYDHAESRYGESCVGPDVFVPTQPDGTTFWCSAPAKGVRYNDLTPRWGVAWDVFGTGRTSIKWNMGKYLHASGFTGVFVDNNAVRRSTNRLTRGWDDLDGDRVVDCDHLNPAAHTTAAGDFCGSLLDGTLFRDFQTFGRPPTAQQLFTANSICGRTENSSPEHQDYCAEAGQNLMSGWDKRRHEWQFGLGVQHELLPRLGVEVTYNRKRYGNLTAMDTLNLGCDYYGSRAALLDYQTCVANHMNYVSDEYDFYSITAPLDPRLPDGGGYVIRGLINQKPDLPSGGGQITLIRGDLTDYTHSVDTNFSLRVPWGLRMSGGTKTFTSVRDACLTLIDRPFVKGRVGNEYRGGTATPASGNGCQLNRPWKTTVNANASYTVPVVDVLLGTVFRYTPGGERSAILRISNTDAVWEPGSAHRVGSLFHTTGADSSTQLVNLLDDGDLSGEGQRLWDLKLGKNIRFAGKRVNIGVDVYNLFNTDTAFGYNNNYTAFRLTDGTWVEDDPTTLEVERNEWGRVTNVTEPRLLRLSIQFEF